MEIVIRPTPADVAVTAADIVAEHVRRGPTVLGLATGSTPIGIYRELIRLHRAGLIEDEVLHELERDLDVEELGIMLQRGDAV